MKHILLPILFLAITAIATPITERYFTLMVKTVDKDGNPTTLADYQIMIDHMNAQFNTYTTNVWQGVTNVTTNTFMAVSPLQGKNAYVNLHESLDLTKHNMWSNTVSGDKVFVYTWWGEQSGKLTKEVLNEVKQIYHEKIFDIAYIDEDLSAWMARGHWVNVTNGVTP